MEVLDAATREKNGSCCGERSTINTPSSAPSEAFTASGDSLGRDVLLYIRHLLRDRRVLIGIGAAVVVGGLVFNWGWLVAVGAAPFILALAPCAAMCALGMCTMGKGKHTSGKDGG